MEVALQGNKDLSSPVLMLFVWLDPLLEAFEAEIRDRQDSKSGEVTSATFILYFV